MKKIVSALIAVLMLTVSVFGAGYTIDTENTGFDRVADKITIKYSGHNDEYMTVFVYDVTKITEASNATPWDGVENTPIIGLDQAIGSGEFNIKIKPDFTGNVVVVLGGEYGDSTKILLNIVNGIPQEITDAVYDAGGDSTVAENRTITVQKGSKLLNATVSTAGTGKVEYTNDDGAVITLTGDMAFDAEGAVDAVSEKTVEIKSENADGSYNVGYINKVKIKAGDTKYIVTLTDSNEKSMIQEFDVSALEGEVRVRVGAEKVPGTVTITQTVTIQ